MCVHGVQAVYCTTELCLSVDKLKEEGKTEGKERSQCTEAMSMQCTFYQLLKLTILTERASLKLASTSHLRGGGKGLLRDILSGGVRNGFYLERV